MSKMCLFTKTMSKPWRRKSHGSIAKKNPPTLVDDICIYKYIYIYMIHTCFSHLFHKSKKNNIDAFSLDQKILSEVQKPYFPQCVRSSNGSKTPEVLVIYEFTACVVSMVISTQLKSITLPETNIFAPENGSFEYDCFLLRMHLFSGADC